MRPDSLAGINDAHAEFSQVAASQHTEYVFKEILGMTDEQLEELVIEGVIE